MARFRPPRDVPDLGLSPGQQARFNAWLRTAFVEIAEDMAALGRVDNGTQVAQETIDVAEGSLRRVTPPVGGMAVRVPPPSSGNAGATIRIMIEAPVGALTIVSRPGVGDDGKVFQPTINGQPRATFTASGLVVLTSNGASDWKTSAEFAAESAASARSSAATLGLGAEYHLASPNTLLPNARVADDSDEIDLDHSVPRVVSWFLKTASVAFSKLANLTGLSVLGRASSSAGVMAAITATGARQALMSNADGDAIGWRSLELSDLPTLPTPDWADVLAEDTSSGANNPSIASGQHIAFAGGAGGNGDIRSSGALIVKAATGMLLDGSSTAELRASQARVQAGSFGALRLYTADTERVRISFSGEIELGAANDPGENGQVMTSSGPGAEPTWSTVDLSSVTYTAGDGIDLAANEFSLNGAEAGEIIRFSTQEDGPNTTGTYEPTIDAETTIYRINPAAGDTITFTGFEFVGGNSGKKFLLLKQGGDGSVVVKHNAGATSTNGAFTPFEVDYVLAGANTACIVWYQTSSARWNIASVTFVNGDGLDLSGNTFSVDVSDFAGAGIEDDGSNNLRIAAAAAGAGLTGGGGSALAVGAGTGITVNANDVAVNQAADFSWTGNHTFNGDIDLPVEHLVLRDDFMGGEEGFNQALYGELGWKRIRNSEAADELIGIPSEPGHPGIVQLQLRTVSDEAVVAMVLGINDINVAPNTVAHGDLTSFEFVVRAPTLADDTGIQFQCGFSADPLDAGGQHDGEGVYFSLNTDLNGEPWLGVCRTGNVSTLTGTLAAGDTGWFRLSARRSGTSWFFSVDGGAETEVAAAAPANTAMLAPFALIRRHETGGGNQDFDVDLVKINGRCVR